MIETENGAWPETHIHTEGASASHAHVNNSVNATMPWLVLIAIVASLSLGLSVSNMTAQARVDTAESSEKEMLQQTLNDIRNRAIDAEVQSQLLREHYDKIANEFAAKGYLFPPLPKNLKSVK